VRGAVWRRQPPQRGVVGLAACLLGAALLVAACGGGDGPGVSHGDDLANGRAKFIEAGCGACHTLAAAPSNGTVGPNLDTAFVSARDSEFEESTFEQVVRSQIAYPGLDSQMQPDLVKGADADDVAFFVAQCAGQPFDEDPLCAPPPPPATGGETGGAEPGGGEDGKAIFTANCATCHTLAAAGATGTVGPNLDEAKPSVELAIDRVTNGMGVMPSFSGTLTEKQIQAVAQFVAESAGA
jgi:mono/diheme cytochrome c family protein